MKQLIDINNILKNDIHLYSHKNNNELETLIEHSNKTFDYYLKISKLKKLNKILSNIIKKLQINDKNEEYLIKEMLLNSIYLHDIGKSNPAFQYIKLNNTKFKTICDKKQNLNSNHSHLSSLIYLSYYYNKIKLIENKERKYTLYYIMFSFSYLIFKHHSSLNNDFSLKNKNGFNFIEEMIPFYNNFYLSNISIEIVNPQNLYKLFHNILNSKINIDNTTLYILMKLTYSLIIGCDYYATHDFMHSSLNLNNTINIEKIRKTFENNKIIKNIRNYQKYNINNFDKKIDQLRSDIFIECENNLKHKNNIFYLEAPTGSGKTLNSFNLALNLIEQNKNLNKILYIFPFNTLVEQTFSTINNIINNDILEKVIINSIVPIQENNNKSTEENFIDRLFNHYPLIFTNHINLFNILFGCSKTNNYPLFNLCNSIIIIDEIQSYKAKLWKNIILFFNKYSELLNIKIIIMSATLPNLSLLNIDNNLFNYQKLIVNRDKYFLNSIFKNRVKVDYSLLYYKDFNLDILCNKILYNINTNYSKFLIEFISKKTARLFFNKIKKHTIDMSNIEIYELSSDDNKFVRNKIIERTKSISKEKKMILITTQVIEAGIDIDMDIGYKDISILDSEEQFLGRINRSNIKTNSIAYFFSIDLTNQIYKGDIRLNKDLRYKYYQQILKEKKFDTFYKECFVNLNNEKDILMKNITLLNYKNIMQQLELINNQNIRIYIPYKLNLSNMYLNGSLIWNKYKALIKNNNLSYADKKIKISKFNMILDYFIYNINNLNIDKSNLDFVGNIYFINDGYKYIDQEYKFNRSLFQERYKN